MGEVGAAGSLGGGFCIGSGFSRGRLKLHQQLHLHQQQQLMALKKSRARCRTEFSGSRSRKLMLVTSQATKEKPSAYTAKISTDIPLYEAPGATFDQYLEDKPRVFQAIFPDKRRSQRLNEEEWRIQMLPIQFLFLTVYPQIDMRLRCKSKGKEYPPGVPLEVSKVLELDIIRWELQGLDDVLKPSHFALGVKGALYPDRKGTRSRLKGQLEMTISFILPPVLALVPGDVLQGVAESVLKRLVENMKHKVNGSLLADYSEFKRKRPGVSLDQKVQGELRVPSRKENSRL